jgi:hypothetical protein
VISFKEKMPVSRHEALTYVEACRLDVHIHVEDHSIVDEEWTERFSPVTGAFLGEVCRKVIVHEDVDYFALQMGEDGETIESLIARIVGDKAVVYV